MLCILFNLPHYITLFTSRLNELSTVLTGYQTLGSIKDILHAFLMNQIDILRPVSEEDLTSNVVLLSTLEKKLKGVMNYYDLLGSNSSYSYISCNTNSMKGILSQGQRLFKQIIFKRFNQNTDLHFEEFTKLETIVLCDYFRELNEETFVGCNMLKMVILPPFLSSIDIRCFFGCTSLSEIHIPDSVSFLRASCFSSSESLTIIYLREAFSKIGRGSFVLNRRLTFISFANCKRLTKIPTSCFQQYINLETVILSPNLLRISNMVFYDCNKLMKCKLSNSSVSQDGLDLDKLIPRPDDANIRMCYVISFLTIQDTLNA
jgi:hypothetical protein